MYLRRSDDGFTIIGFILIFVLIIAITYASFVVYKNINSHPHFSLLPTKISQEQCPNGMLNANFAYAQIALENISCSNPITSNIVEASYWYGAGVQFNHNGWYCQTFKESGHTEWSSFWDGTYYTYFCADNNQKIAYNAGTYDGAGAINEFGLFEPDAEGQSQCPPTYGELGSLTYTQVFVSDPLSCNDVPSLAQMAASKLGVKFISENYYCFVNPFNGDSTDNITTELKNYYVYSCDSGTQQIAFIVGLNN